MKSKRKRHDNTFKARVALEGLKGIKSIQEIAKEFDLHPMQVSKWKRSLQQSLPGVFERVGKSKGRDDFEVEREKLHSKIGQLTIEVDFLIKKSKQLGL
jgi:transposase-like protein